MLFLISNMLISYISVEIVYALSVLFTGDGFKALEAPLVQAPSLGKKYFTYF